MQAYVTSPVVTQQPHQQQPQPYTVPNNERVFPVRSFKIFGGIQIGLGILVGLLCIIGIILDTTSSEYQCSYWDYYTSSMYYYSCHRGYKGVIFAFDITCLLCYGWFILTGFLLLCMSQNRQSSWRCLKIAFMVCSIIGAAVFVPTVFSLGVAGSFWRAFYDNKSIALSALIAVLSFVELVVAIVAASFCCCCTQWDTTAQQSFMIIGGPQPHVIMMPPQTQLQVGQFQGVNMQPYVMTAGTNNQPQQQYQIVNPTSQNPNMTGVLQASANQEHLNPPPYKE